MLVLSRHKDEKINIGNDIVVTVAAIQGNSVRLGITAPDGVEIWRSEIDPGNRSRDKPKNKGNS